MKARDINGNYYEVDADTLTPNDEIEMCKQALSESDYKCLKFADGELTDEEYAPIREYRKQLRKRINELESSD